MPDAQMLKPSVAESLLGDEGVVSLMSHPKMREALSALKDDPSQYKRIVGEDPELAEMMRSLQGAMSKAETEEERAEAHAEEERAAAIRETARARDDALAAGKAGAWARAVSACDSGLRAAPADGELAKELLALRARYAERLAETEREASLREERAVAEARAEVEAATKEGRNATRLQAAIAAARSRGLATDAAVLRAQRRLVELLEQQSGERMRQMRQEAARRAAQQAAAVPVAGAKDEQPAAGKPLTAATTVPPSENSTAKPAPRVAQSVAEAPEAVPQVTAAVTAAVPADADVIREKVLASATLLYELD